MICNKCNHKLPDDSEFCQYCGTKIEIQPLETISVEGNSTKTKNEQPNDSIDLQAKETNVKMKYCSRCGAVIDNATKQCTGCGKQYFKGIKINKGFIIVLLAVLLMSSVVLNVVQLISKNQVEQELDVALEKNNKLLNEINNLEGKVKSKESEVSKLANQVSSQKKIVDFVNRNVAFRANDGTNCYHKVDCDRFNASYGFYVYGKNTAKSLGLRRCSSCYSFDDYVYEKHHQD